MTKTYQPALGEILITSRVFRHSRLFLEDLAKSQTDPIVASEKRADQWSVTFANGLRVTAVPRSHL